jgi:hypothetical protein
VGEPVAGAVASPVPKLGPADMGVEAFPATAAEDKKAKKEWTALFGSMLEDGAARVIGVYVDILLRALMAGAFFWLTRDWLTGVLKILEKQQAIPVRVRP